MNNEIKGSKKKKPYPYVIKPFNLDWVKDVKALSRTSILEFFRVEALLRSTKLHELLGWKKGANGLYGGNFQILYESVVNKESSGAMLFKKYGITWDVLWNSSHHDALDQREGVLKGYDSGAYMAPVCDVKADVFNSIEEEKRAESWKQQLLSYKPDIADGNLIFQLNVLHSPESIIKKLRPLLKKAHDDYKNKPHTTRECRRLFPFDDTLVDGPEFPVFNESKVPKKGLREWLNYFRWYDRNHCDGLTQEQVTQEAFGLRDTYSTKELSNVSQGIARAKKMIKAAETCQWPPVNLS